MNNFNPKEFKVVALRECPVPESMLICETPDHAADYWRLHIATHPYFNPDCECFVVLILNTRRRVKGHQLVSIGTMDTTLVSSSRGIPCGCGWQARPQSYSCTITRAATRRRSRSRHQSDARFDSRWPVAENRSP